MRRWNWMVALAVGVLLLGAVAPLQAQEDDYYLDEEIDRDPPGKYQLGIGFGLVELGDNIVFGQSIVDNDDVEPYFTINLRIRFGDPYANPGPGRSGGFRAFLEPELGYWSASGPGFDASDTLLGINIIGAQPVNAVQFFIGAGIGVHFTDSEIRVRNVQRDVSNEAIGVNAQFGVDVSMSKKVALFGVGRFDLVDDDRDELEGKVYLGLRFRFGDDD